MSLPRTSRRGFWSFEMLNVNIVCVGKLKEKYWRDAVCEYSKRLSRFCRLTVFEAEESDPQKEMPVILKNCRGYVIALCVEGEQMTSEKLAQTVEKVAFSNSSITFVIGSSTGLADGVKSAADLKLSFSKMTFPHQMMRVVLLEQIYRAFTINNNIKYHK